MMKTRFAYLALVCLSFLSLAPSVVRGQVLGAGQNLPQQPALKTAPVAPRFVMPQAEDLLALIRSTILALNHANQTGNYTVLRDLAAPDFREANDAARLAAIFQVLREQNVDLTPLLNIPPQLSANPTIDAQGLLRLVGDFPTTPLKVNFELLFQAVQGRWRPYTLTVFLARAEAQLQAPALKLQTGSVKK